MNKKEAEYIWNVEIPSIEQEINGITSRLEIVKFFHELFNTKLYQKFLALDIKCFELHCKVFEFIDNDENYKEEEKNKTYNDNAKAEKYFSSERCIDF